MNLTLRNITSARQSSDSASAFTRWAGLAAIVGGGLFIGMQAIHPPETLAAVSTDRWAIVHYLGVAMCLLNAIAVAGIHARQARGAGWLGLGGFALLTLMWLLTAAFQFVEAFILPLLVTESPAFVEGFTGITSGAASEADLGVFPAVYAINGVLYLAGGVLLGIATLRAGILPRAAGALLAIGTVAPIALSLLPHEYVRLAAVPVGLVLMWLGYCLFAEQREQASAPVTGAFGAQIQAAEAE